MSLQQVVKTSFDTVSAGVAFSTLFKILPPAAALASILWLLWRFYEEYPGSRLEKFLNPDKKE